MYNHILFIKFYLFSSNNKLNFSNTSCIAPVITYLNSVLEKDKAIKQKKNKKVLKKIRVLELEYRANLSFADENLAGSSPSSDNKMFQV